MTCHDAEREVAAIDRIPRIQQTFCDQDPQLLQQQSMQQQRLDAVGSLASGIAHEFNNLLQAIRAYTLFAVESLPEKSQAYNDLQKVLRASERASGLTRQLLDFSRAQETDLQQCEIDPIVQELANMLGPLLPNEINLQLQLNACHAQVVIDVQLIHQAVLNLCLNARDAMTTGGQLTISSEVMTHRENGEDANFKLSAGEYVCLAVSDTGSGIPEEVQLHMFDPFYTTKEVGKGTGLGLSVTHGVVQQVGGQIRCESEIHRGTTFLIYLPVINSN